MNKIAASSDALNMHSLRAARTAGFERVECLHNVSVPDPSVHGYVLKDDMFLPKWLSKVSIFNVMQQRVYQIISYLAGINFCIVFFR